MRTNKKQEYINSLRFDNDYYQEVIGKASSKKLEDQFYWHHGVRYHVEIAKQNLAENVEELNKIFADKTYKPWKELP